tara:strand:+ start:223 stop:918 length:696 start_codon:yes stop_codon:yes gene_type:complete
MKNLFILALCAICIGHLFSNRLSASGLLGKRYMGVSIGFLIPGDNADSEYDNFWSGYGGIINLPFNKNIDGHLTLRTIAGEGNILNENIKTTYQLIDGSLIYSLSPNQKTNPFLKIARHTQSANVKYTETSTSLSDSTKGYSLGFGAEFLYEPSDLSKKMLFGLLLSKKISNKMTVKPEINYFNYDDIDPYIISSISIIAWFTEKISIDTKLEYSLKNSNIYFISSLSTLF